MRERGPWLKRPWIVWLSLMGLLGSGSLHASTLSAIERSAEEKLFPRYELLEPNVRFWKIAFTEYSEHQTIFHSREFMDKVLKVLDFSAEASVLDKEKLWAFRRKSEKKAYALLRSDLQKAHEGRSNPSALRGEPRRLYSLFKDVRQDNRFQLARNTLRSQRGLRDRTRRAVETSGGYLPAMENIFRGYGLPVSLTRLPLVESSFDLDAYSKVGAAGLWQFIPSSARAYMRLNEVVDDRRDPWISTDAAARHLRDDHALLKSWPLALTAYNHGRGGVARGLKATGGTELPDLIERYKGRRFGFASKNFYAEFLAAYDIEKNWKQYFPEVKKQSPIQYDVVSTSDYVAFDTLQALSTMDRASFLRLNPAYRPEVMQGRLHVPPGHNIRVPPGAAKQFETAYAELPEAHKYSRQKQYFVLHKVRRGQTLSGIAGRYGVTQRSIRSSNPIRNRNHLRIGQVLKIIPRDFKSKPGGKSPQVRQARKKTAKRTASSTHRVRKGQTLSHLAQAYGVSVRSIRVANGLGRSSTIRVGQRLKIPTGKKGGTSRFQTHRIRSGQTLTHIARQYDVSVNDLRLANGMGRSSRIRAGDRLKVPVRN